MTQPGIEPQPTGETLYSLGQWLGERKKIANDNFSKGSCSKTGPNESILFCNDILEIVKIFSIF